MQALSLSKNELTIDSLAGMLECKTSLFVFVWRLTTVMIVAYKKKSEMAVAIWLLIAVVAIVYVIVIDDKQSASGSLWQQLIAPMLGVANGIAFPSACWFYVKSKDRSGWWILVLPLQHSCRRSPSKSLRSFPRRSGKCTNPS